MESHADAQPDNDSEAVVIRIQKYQALTLAEVVDLKVGLAERVTPLLMELEALDDEINARRREMERERLLTISTDILELLARETETAGVA